MIKAWDERDWENGSFQGKEQEPWERIRRRFVTQERGRGKEAVVRRCPQCGEELEEIFFRGVTVERCTGCSGVWLNAGEVERLTARANQGWLSHFWRTMGPLGRIVVRRSGIKE
ncbi:MAG: zf-TFIIB domain-containing protein [Candidatus Binatia bacterium]